MNGRERILALLAGQPIDRPPFMPITMMFAADHIGVNYREYATDYRLLAKGQQQVAETYDFDYVSCISDPAREAADCGAAIEYFENQPPAFFESRALLTDKAVLKTLVMPDPLQPGRMQDRVQAAALLHETVGKEKLVEGWVEGPCAEGADLRGINTLMMDFYEDPDFVTELFEFVTELGLRFAKAQLQAGAEIIGVGDAAASLIGPDIYKAYVWPYQRKLVEGIHALGGLVRLHICGNTRAILSEMGQLGCDIVDLDWMAPMEEARAAMGENQVLLGNIDPVSVLRNGTPMQVETAIRACHAAAQPRYIISAGCEVVRDTPLENLRAMNPWK